MSDTYLFSLGTFNTNCDQPAQSLAWITENYLLVVRSRNGGKQYAVVYDVNSGKLIYRLVQIEPLYISACRTNWSDNSRLAPLCGIAEQGSAFLWRPFRHSVGIQSLYSKTNSKNANQVFVAAENAVLALCDDYKRVCLITDTQFRGFSILNSLESEADNARRESIKSGSLANLTKSKTSSASLRSSASPSRNSNAQVQLVATAYDECAARLAIVSHTTARCETVDILIGTFDFDLNDAQGVPTWSRYELNVTDPQTGFEQAPIDPLYEITVALRSLRLVLFANLSAASRTLIICQLPAFEADDALNKLSVLRVVRFAVTPFSHNPTSFDSFIFIQDERVTQLTICDLDSSSNGRKAAFSASGRRSASTGATGSSSAGSVDGRQRALQVERSVIVAMTNYGAFFALDSDGALVRLHAAVDSDEACRQVQLTGTCVGYRPFQFVTSSNLASPPRNAGGMQLNAGYITKQTFSFAIRHIDTLPIELNNATSVDSRNVTSLGPTAALFKLALSDGFSVQTCLLVLPTLNGLVESTFGNCISLSAICDVKLRFEVAERERLAKISLRFPKLDDDEDAFSDSDSPRSLLNRDAVKSLSNGSFNILLQGLLSRSEQSLPVCNSDEAHFEDALRVLELIMSSFYHAECRCLPTAFAALERALVLTLEHVAQHLHQLHTNEHDGARDCTIERFERVLAAFWHYDRHFRCFDALLVQFARDLLHSFDCDMAQRAGSDLFERFFARTYSFRVEGDAQLVRLRLALPSSAHNVLDSAAFTQPERRVSSLDACSFEDAIDHLCDTVSSCLHARELCDVLTEFCRNLLLRCELVNAFTFICALNEKKLGEELRSLRVVLQANANVESVREMRRKCGALFGESDCDAICSQLLVALVRTLAVLLLSLFVRQQVVDCFFDTQRTEECSLMRYVVQQLVPTCMSANLNKLADASRFVEFKSSKLGQLICEPQICLQLMLGLALREDSITFCYLHSDFVSALKLAMLRAKSAGVSPSDAKHNRRMAARLLKTLIKRQLKTWANTNDELNEQNVIDFLQCANALLECCSQRSAVSIYLSVERGLLRKMISIAKQYFAPAANPVDCQTVARLFFFAHNSLPLPAAPLFVSQAGSAQTHPGTNPNSSECQMRTSLARLVRLFLLSLHAHSVTINDQRMTALRAFGSLYLRMLRNVYSRNAQELSVLPLLTDTDSSKAQQTVTVLRQSSVQSSGFDEQTATFDRHEFKLFRSFVSFLWYITVRDRLSYAYHEALFEQSDTTGAQNDDCLRRRLGLLERIYPFLCAFSDPLSIGDCAETEWKTEELFQLLLLNVLAQLNEKKLDTVLRLAFYFPVCDEGRRSSAVQNRLTDFVRRLQAFKLDRELPAQLQAYQAKLSKGKPTLSLAYRMLTTGLHREVAEKWRLLVGDFREFERFSDAVSELTRQVRPNNEQLATDMAAPGIESEPQVLESSCTIGSKFFELDSEFHAFLDMFQSVTGASFSQLRCENVACADLLANPSGANFLSLFDSLKFDFVFSDLTNKELKTLFDGACDFEHSISVCELGDQLVNCVYKFTVAHAW